METAADAEREVEDQEKPKDQDKTALGSVSGMHILNIILYPCTMPWSAIPSFLVFYDDSDTNTFGTMKKDQKRPLSNFSFDFITKILAADSCSTGYLVDVTPERVGGDSTDSGDDTGIITRRYKFKLIHIYLVHGLLFRDVILTSLSLLVAFWMLSSFMCRKCFFTSDSTMKKDRFMQQLNRSYGEGGLTCGFNDFQLAEFIQQKMRNAGRLPTKKAVQKVGPQEDGTWVLGPDIYINPEGEIIDPSQSQYMWISHLFDGPGIASQREACPIKQPLTTESLHALVQHLAATMEHNFVPSLMVLGSCAMALHYHTILGKFLFCPIPLAFGESGTGKTTALRCGLAITGVYPS